MNKKILSALLLVAFAFASSSMFVSCKDYDDDIKNLQTQIDSLKKTLEEIQKQIQNGAILNSVTPTTGGVTLTLSNGKTYTITNGKDGADGEDGADGKDGVDGKDGANGTNGKDGVDGKDGDVWTIDAQGYWCKNGVKYTDENWPNGICAKGKDGKDGSDGSDGQPGEPGQDGQSAAGSGIYFVPNAETGCFDKYQNGVFVEATNISFVNSEKTNSNIITAVKTPEALTLYGVEGGEGTLKSVAISLSGTLKSLVFIPHFYLDGIETIEYPWIGDSTLVKKAPVDYYQTTHHKKHIKNAAQMFNYLPDNLSENPEGPIPTRKAIIYGPVIGVDYEINPSNAVLAYETNQPSYKVLEPDVVYANTRAAAATLKVSSPEKYGRFTEDANVWGISSSDAKQDNSTVNYLTAGLKIEKPNYLEPYPTSDSINGGYLPENLDDSYTMTPMSDWYSWYLNDTGKHKDTDNTIALQLHNCENADVTSDYALLIPSRIRLEGLIWATKPMYQEPGFGPAAGGVTGDEYGWYSKNDKIFVWDSPKEALDNAIGSALELPIYDDFIDLKTYLGIRILKENVKTRRISAVNWRANEFTAKTAVDRENVAKYYGQEEYFDLHYEFQLVDYMTDTNDSHDSRYATFTDTEGLNDARDASISTTGRIRSLTVDELKASTIEEGRGSATAVDREPLVRVMVKNTAGDVLLDGYILIHITNTKDNKTITYPTQDKKFNTCDSIVYSTTWNQFSKIILQDSLNHYEKLTFDYFYWADCQTGGTVDAVDEPFVTAEAKNLPAYDGHMTYSMRIFNFGGDIYGGGRPELKGNNDAKEEKSNAFEDKALGVVRYYPNADGQTNHRFDWILTADEAEYLTRGKQPNEAVTVSRWIRFKAKTYEEANENMADGTVKYTQDDYNAPYPYIWVKLTMTIQRDPLQAKYTKKIDDWWYNYSTGAATDGWSSYLVDIEAPRNGKTIKDMNWYGITSHTLYTNVPVLTQYEDNTKALANALQKGVYYFAPKTYEITGVSGRKYTITPQRSSVDVAYKTMYNTYIVKGNTFTKKNGTDVATVKVSQSTTWDEAKLKADMYAYSYNPDLGVFANDTLYAYDQTKKTYTPIAYIINQVYDKAADVDDNDQAGEIQLFHWLDGAKGSSVKTDDENWVCYDIINAIGYEANNANIAKEFRAWLGFVGTKCEDKVAFYVEQDQYDDANVATFQSSWKRPINLPNMDPDEALDAKTNENTVYVVDNLNMFDWRGDKPNQGYMYDNHYWFWGYYNIKGVAIVLDPAKVEIKLNDDSEWVKLNTVTTKLRLTPLAGYTSLGAAYPYNDLYAKLANAYYYDFENIDDLTQYNADTKEAAIEQVLGINPVSKANKAKFGGFYYENDALTITSYTVKFPIAIRYEWGWLFDNEFTWKINTTHGGTTTGE